MRILLFFVWAGAAFLHLLGQRPNARASSVCVARGGLGPPQPAQGLQGDQRAGQEHGRAVHVAEEEQEAEGEDVAWQRQLSGPGLGDAEKSQKTCERQFKKTNSGPAYVLLAQHSGLNPSVSVFHKVTGGGKSALLNSPVTATSLKTSRQQQQKLTALQEAGSQGRTRRVEASLHVHHAVAASNTPSMASAKHVHTGFLYSSGW